MRLLLIAPQLGVTTGKEYLPGGLPQFCRTVCRALATMPHIEKLGVWAQVEAADVSARCEALIAAYAHRRLKVEVRCFGGDRARLTLAAAQAGFRSDYDRVHYMLMNQAVLGLLPRHPPYDVWLIGREARVKVARSKALALKKADRLIGISKCILDDFYTENVNGTPSRVVHACLDPENEVAAPAPPYNPAARRPIVLIVANMLPGLRYKGHRELILGWPEVLSKVPGAELWIAGGGLGRPEIELLVAALPAAAQRAIKFLGILSNTDLHAAYNQSRVFAMPSSNEGFGLVFVEAARFGLPSIGGKHDGVKEVVVDRETGLLVEQEPEAVAQACIQLLSDDALSARMGQAAHSRYTANFTFERFRERMSIAMFRSMPSAGAAS